MNRPEVRNVRAVRTERELARARRAHEEARARRAVAASRRALIACVLLGGLLGTVVAAAMSAMPWWVPLAPAALLAGSMTAGRRAAVRSESIDRRQRRRVAALEAELVQLTGGGGAGELSGSLSDRSGAAGRTDEERTASRDDANEARPAGSEGAEARNGAAVREESSQELRAQARERLGGPRRPAGRGQREDRSRTERGGSGIAEPVRAQRAAQSVRAAQSADSADEADSSDSLAPGGSAALVGSATPVGARRGPQALGRAESGRGGAVVDAPGPAAHEAVPAAGGAGALTVVGGSEGAGPVDFVEDLVQEVTTATPPQGWHPVQVPAPTYTLVASARRPAVPELEEEQAPSAPVPARPTSVRTFTPAEPDEPVRAPIDLDAVLRRRRAAGA